MANLHKTERKLPWRVRDAGLPSDWLRGRIGGKFSAVKLVWHARHSSKERIHTCAHTHPRGESSNLSFILLCVCIKKTTKKQPCVYCISSRILKKYGISVNKSPFTHDVNFTVLMVSGVYSNTKTNYLHPFLV